MNFSHRSQSSWYLVLKDKLWVGARLLLVFLLLHHFLLFQKLWVGARISKTRVIEDNVVGVEGTLAKNIQHNLGVNKKSLKKNVDKNASESGKKKNDRGSFFHNTDTFPPPLLAFA